VCTNLANLLLARAASRQRELAVRTALGAPRGRLVRQFLVESAVLSCAGGALGVLLAYWGKDLFLVWINTGQSYVLEPKLDLRVLAFTASVALLTGLVVGLFPALKATRVDLRPSMKEGSASALPRSYVSRTLMVAQVAMSVVLLVGAGLFVRTLRNLRHADVGFDRTNLLLFDAGLRRGDSGPRNDDAVFALYDEVTRRLNAIPGVRAATFSEYALLSGDLAMPYLYVPGRTPPPGEDPTVFMQSVHPSFFETMGMPLLTGRTLTDRDARAHARVAVVNEALVRRYSPDGSALGRRIGVTKDQTLSAMPDSELLEIVGVVRDAKFSSVRQDIPIAMFRPMDRARPVTFEVRTSIDPMGLAPSIRAAVADIDRSLPVNDFRSQEAAAERSFAEERHFAFLTSLFGLLAALLACLGLYGLVSYHVTRRTHEIGVRMALGASRGRVVGLVMRETLAMAAAGVVIGLVTAAGVTRFIASLLFGLPRNDASTLGAAALLMLAVAAAAGLLPGWRAAKVDPLVALRHE
jgi:predicted permease